MTFTASLTSDLTSTDEIIHVDTNTGARTTYPWRLLIDDEALYVTAGVEEGLDWTVLRGADDTDPADHLSGTLVSAAPLSDGLAQLTGTQTTYGHFYVGDEDPEISYGSEVQIGDIWIDTTGGAPYQTKRCESLTPGQFWQVEPMIAKDALGAVVALVRVDGVAEQVTLETGDISVVLNPYIGGLTLTLDPNTSIQLGGGNINITAAAGDLILDASAGNIYAGALTLTGSAASLSGPVTMSGLPTADPAVAGELWNDSGTLKVSAG